MPDLADLPILTELRADLARAFAAAEQTTSPIPAPVGVGDRTSRGGAFRRPRGLRWKVAAGFALAAGVIVAVVPAVGPGSGPTAPASAVAKELGAIAKVAAAQPSLFPDPGQYYYVRSFGSNISMFAGVDPGHEHAVTLVTREREEWRSATREGRIVQGAPTTRPLTPADATREQGPDAAAVDLPQVPLGPQHRAIIGNEQLTRDQLAGFPTDPKAVHDRLVAGYQAGQGHSPEQELFTQIADALRSEPLPPDVRAGLYGALAYVPGVELLGEAKDRLGRTGVGVAFTDRADDTRTELIVDPGTSELLAEQQRIVGPDSGIDAPTGTIIGDTVYEQRAVTDDLERPAGATP